MVAASSLVVAHTAYHGYQYTVDNTNCYRCFGRCCAVAIFNTQHPKTHASGLGLARFWVRLSTSNIRLFESEFGLKSLKVFSADP